MTSSSSSSASHFLVMLAGQIESAEFPEYFDVYCKYKYVFGQDWTVLSGIEDGMSQLTQQSQVETMDGIFVLNFPLEITFQSSSPYGWPQLVLSFFGSDFRGNDVVRGYGACHVPISPGRHTRRVALFVPESSSLLHKLNGWLIGRRPEFHDATIVAHADGRDVTRVSTQGFANVTFNVVVKDVKILGYDCHPASMSHVSEFPLSNLPGPSDNIGVARAKHSGDDPRDSVLISPPPPDSPKETSSSAKETSEVEDQPGPSTIFRRMDTLQEEDGSPSKHT